jgi:hypothetical protein
VENEYETISCIEIIIFRPITNFKAKKLLFALAAHEMRGRSTVDCDGQRS